MACATPRVIFLGDFGRSQGVRKRNEDQFLSLSGREGSFSLAIHPND
jgi:hypothetical protein